MFQKCGVAEKLIMKLIAICLDERHKTYLAKHDFVQISSYTEVSETDPRLFSDEEPRDLEVWELNDECYDDTCGCWAPSKWSLNKRGEEILEEIMKSRYCPGYWSILDITCLFVFATEEALLSHLERYKSMLYQYVAGPDGLKFETIVTVKLREVTAQ